MLSYHPLLPYKGPQLSLSTYVVTPENASRWIITPENPAGQLTAFLVFDGWTNVDNLVLALATVVSALLWMPRTAGTRLARWLFAATNVCGLLSPSAIYLFAPSNFADWGMSAATFGALGFGVACSGYILCHAFASFLTRTGNAQYRRPRNILPLFATTVLFLLSLEYLQGTANPNVMVFAVHVTSALIGGLIGLLATVGIKSRERRLVEGLFHFPLLGAQNSPLSPAGEDEFLWNLAVSAS